MRDYANSEYEAVICEYIHNDKERDIARRRLIDGHTIEQIAEEFDKSTRQMQRIITRIQTKVFLHLG